MKVETTIPDTPPANQKEFSFRAIFFGVFIGIILMALMMYLDAVLGLDTDVAPIASMIGVLLIPLFGGPTSRREVNIMQTCATATTFAAYSLTGNIIPMLMMGEKLEIFPIIVLLLLADAIGICFVSILRDQFVYDKQLPFPGAIMCTTAMDQIDSTDKSSTKLLFSAIGISIVISFLQNMYYIPWQIDFTSHLPEGMTLGIMIMPLMLGLGYVLGSRIGICMMIASLLVYLVEGPVGTKQGWFTDPAVDYASSIQEFNLPMVVGMALLAALIPILRQRKSFLNAFKFKGGISEGTDRDYSLKTVTIGVIVLNIIMIAFCNIYYGISIIALIICAALSMLFSMIAVRVSAESGLSAGIALNIFMIVIAFVLTKNAVYTSLIAFTNFNTFILAQDTMYDLKIGQMVGASPKKQLKAQFIGIVFGSLAGVALFYAIVTVFGLNDDVFVYPYGKMYFSMIDGLSSGGVSGFFNLGRFAIGGVLGTIFALIGLPAGGIALALYLAPRTILGIALGGFIRLIVEKTKGDDTACKLDNVATGLVIGDATVCIIMVVISLFTS